MIKVCSFCGKEFETKYALQRYCCRACNLQGRYKRQRKTNRNVRECAIGTERIRHSKGGSYVEVKTKQPNEWAPKNIYVYEKTHNVKVVRGKEVIRCLDGNNRNSAPENLYLLSRKENCHVNRYIDKCKIKVTPEVMNLIILYVKVRIARVTVAKKFGLVHVYAHSRTIISDQKKAYKREMADPIKKERRRKRGREAMRRRMEDPEYRARRNEYHAELRKRKKDQSSENKINK